MNAHRSIRPLAILALCLVAPLSGARSSGRPLVQGQDGPRALSASELVLDQFPVQHVDANELFELVYKLIARSFYVKERGEDGGDAVDSMRLLGETIVLYDTKEEVQRAREMLTRLDVNPTSNAGTAESVEYRPHFVSLDTAQAAVGSLVDEVRTLEERNMIVLQGQREDIDAALALLKRVDMPERQVFLTCQMVEVGATQPGIALPKELLDNLQKLLPQMQFAQTGLSMLKTSVNQRMPISLRIEGTGGSYRLSFTPVAYDEASGSLTISGCALLDETNMAMPRELFRTNTVLRGNEYTVLAATGATPKLLVLRVVAQN